MTQSCRIVKVRTAAEMEACYAMELGAQLQATPFYEKLGFSCYGDTYDDAGVPHRSMRLSLLDEMQ